VAATTMLWSSSIDIEQRWWHLVAA